MPERRTVAVTRAPGRVGTIAVAMPAVRPERAKTTVGAGVFVKMVGQCHPWIGRLAPRTTEAAPVGAGAPPYVIDRMVVFVAASAATTAVPRRFIVTALPAGRCHV